MFSYLAVPSSAICCFCFAISDEPTAPWGHVVGDLQRRACGGVCAGCCARCTRSRLVGPLAASEVSFAALASFTACSAFTAQPSALSLCRSGGIFGFFGRACVFGCIARGLLRAGGGAACRLLGGFCEPFGSCCASSRLVGRSGEALAEASAAAALALDSFTAARASITTSGDGSAAAPPSTSPLSTTRNGRAIFCVTMRALPER